MAAMEEAGDEGDSPRREEDIQKPDEPEEGEEGSSPEPTKTTWRAGTPIGQLLRSSAKSAASPGATSPSPPAKTGKSAEPEEKAERERHAQATEEVSGATLPIANRRERDQDKITIEDEDVQLPDFEEELRWKEEQEEREQEEEAKRLASHFEVDEEAPPPAQTKSPALFDKNKTPEHEHKKPEEHNIGTPGPGAAAGHEG